MKNRSFAQNSSRSIKGAFKHLFEQGLFDEEPKKEDKPEEGGEDKPEEAGEDKPAEEGEDKPEEAGEDKPAEEKKDDKDKEKKDKSPKPTTAQKAAAEDSVRTEIQKYLIRARSDAEAALASEDPDYVKKESRMKSLKHVYRKHLWEGPQEDVKLDLQVFASQVYNMIANWKNIFDMPAIILNNAIVFLQDEYQDEKVVEKFKEVMRKEYPDVKIPLPPGDEDVSPNVPFAVGARSPAG